VKYLLFQRQSVLILGLTKVWVVAR
jgi:hypothetical protein